MNFQTTHTNLVFAIKLATPRLSILFFRCRLSADKFFLINYCCNKVVNLFLFYSFLCVSLSIPIGNIKKLSLGKYSLHTMRMFTYIFFTILHDWIRKSLTDFSPIQLCKSMNFFFQLVVKFLMIQRVHI